MSTGKPPGKSAGRNSKPFLGDDDLVSELDAWDATFDALHGSDEDAALQKPSAEHVIAWPQADAARRSGAEPAQPDYSDPTAIVEVEDARSLDRLGSEFDADDAAFDAPYDAPESSYDTSDDGAFAAPESPSIGDEAARGVDDAVGDATSAAIDLSADDDGGELEDRMTLDRALDGAGAEPAVDPGAQRQRASSMTSVDTAQAEDPLEADFSDLGSDLGGETRMGEFDFNDDPPAPAPVQEVGRRGRQTLPPPIDDDDLAIRTQLHRPSGPHRRPPSDDDGVYTSASRPNPLASRGRYDLDDDGIAPPPPPEPRRGPAIVRRSIQQPVVQPIGHDESQVTPPHGHDMSLFAEQTRIADTSELEERASASRGSAPGMPALDDDAYDDIEIGGEERAGASTAIGVPAAPAPTAPAADFSAGRRTAHVLRRADTPTRPPPIVQQASNRVIEMEADEELSAPNLAARAPSEPGAEDDFSDVAAAVGANGDVDIADVPDGFAERRTPVPTGDDLADALADLDDPLPIPTLLDPPSRPNPVMAPQLQPMPTLGQPPPPPMAPPRPMAIPDRASDVASGGTRKGIPALDPRLPSRPVAPSPAQALAQASSAELFPRVKTPTSVPPMRMDARSARTLEMEPAEPPPERYRRAATPLPVDGEEAELELEPTLDLEAVGRAWPEQVAPLPSAALDEACAASLLVYEREVATLDDSAASAALRIEAGRLCERLSDFERARTHYDAALLADPRATGALRGLRRIARAAGDLVEATRHLDSEIAVTGALERRPLGHYRIDLLMASGEQDLARVAVGEMLDTTPSDVRALLAQLELAFLDGRADEFGSALEQLAHAVTDHELRAAAQAARGALAAHQNEIAAAMSWFTAAADVDPGALAARLGAVRYAAAQADGDAAARALIDLARQIEAGDPITAAAASIRAQQWASAELGASAAQVANAAAPSDPLVARLGAELAARALADDPVTAASAFAHWAACATAPAERAYAAARAAELDSARGAELWGTALELDPGDDYAAAQLRTAHVASEATDASIAVDVAVAADAERDRARLRAAYGLIAAGKLDDAIALLTQGRAQRPRSLAIAEALGEALAAAGNWTARAKLFAELAAEPGEQLDREVAQLRSALAWEEAVGSIAAVAEVPPGGEEPPDLPGVIAAALESWERVLEQGAQAPSAHAAAIALASRLGDRDALADVLARAQAAERSPWAAASLALRRARLYADDPQHVETILRDLQPAEDPRRTVGRVLTAARMKDLGDAAAALEERSRVLDERSAATEVAALRLRAAQLALDAGDAPRATRLLGKVEQALPGLGVVPDLLAAARRRAGDRPTASAHARRTEPAPGASASDAFARIVRDADLANAHGDGAAALALYQRALELRPGDPLATVPLIRTATQLREPAVVTSLALAQLAVAEDANDGPAKAAAYELIAHIDTELRADPESAQIALESASRSDPSRVDLLHRLERQYAVADDLPELLRLRQASLDATPPELARDRAALLLDLSGLATRDGRTEVEVADIYRRVLETDPAIRLALLHLESTVRGSGFSEELAALEEKIAAYFEGDARTQAAFWTRAGETLAELGQIDAAVQRFGKAEAALPGHVPALEGWRQAALKGQLWIDVAEAATRQAGGASDPKQRAALHHLAGVALMDKALVGDQAMAAFHRALDADQGHRDSFLRLRILLEEDANHDDLATLLSKRLEVEPEHAAKIELHRALAELHRNFLSDRDTAKLHYRAILDDDPNDLRAHAAVADIAWEQGNWQEAADALMSRARLEREPEVLKTLCFRLGLIYADRLVDPPMALKAFQRALSYQPDDENTLVRLADLATQVGEFKLALGACERLVKNEADADRRVAHLHRVAKIFKTGFGDMKRAERALNLALDGAPTNDEALQQLVQFYREARDLTSVRVHLNRVAGSMRARVQQAPLEGVPYRVISRAMAARAATGFAGSAPIARAAAQLADLLGATGEPEQKLLMEQQTPDLSLLVKSEADEFLYPRGVQVELRQVFQLLGDRIAKHVGVDLRPYGATRGDRLRAKDNPVAAVAQSVATSLGFGEIDVYVSQRQPWVMIAEPTSPVSLIIGSSIAGAGGDAIRFAAGGALKLAQAQLAIPARLPADDLGVLVVALMRLFQPEFPIHGVDADGVAAQLQKLRRLIPTSLLNELRPFALAIDSQRFSHRELARDLKVTALRAGLVASGSLLVGLRILAGQSEGELPGFIADPVAQGLVSFALGEDHAAVAR